MDMPSTHGWGFPQHPHYGVAPPSYMAAYQPFPAPPSSSTPPHQATPTAASPHVLHQYPFVAYGFPDRLAARRRRHHRGRRSLSADSQDSGALLEEKGHRRDPFAAKDPAATQQSQPPSYSHPPGRACPQHAETAGVFCLACSQEHTHTMIAGLEDSVAGVKATMASTMGRIADMIAEMVAAKHTPSAELKQHGPESAVEKPVVHVDVATSTPTAWIRTSASKKAPGGVVEIGSDSHPADQSAPQAALPRASTLPPLHSVPTAEGSHTVQNTGDCVEISPTKKPTTRRTSAVPRMRAVPSPKPAFRRPPASEENTSATESTDTSPKPTRQQVPAGNKKRRDFVCPSLTSDSVPAMQPRSRSAPLRYGTHCWVMHPGFNNDVIGIARAGVNSRSRSHHTDLVHAC